jgi:hypothetical protein
LGSERFSGSSAVSGNAATPSRSPDVKRQAILIATWAGHGAFKAAALIIALVIIVALWLWNASLLTMAADENLRVIKAASHFLPPDWASKAESALRIFGADRALLLVEGIALAKLIMLAVAYPFRRRRWHSRERSPGEQPIEGSDMVPTGHIPNTAGIGLDEAGIELDARGYVRINERLRTTAPNVGAIGEGDFASHPVPPPPNSKDRCRVGSHNETAAEKKLRLVIHDQDAEQLWSCLSRLCDRTAGHNIGNNSLIGFCFAAAPDCMHEGTPVEFTVFSLSNQICAGA